MLNQCQNCKWFVLLDTPISDEFEGNCYYNPPAVVLKDNTRYPELKSVRPTVMIWDSCHNHEYGKTEVGVVKDD